MLPYSRQLKQSSREVRGHMTDAEQKLWYRLRRKQINGWQFYRQKSLGSYIVDFYCPAASLAVELDGSQHLEPQHQAADQQRDAYLMGLGLRVLRFDNRQVLLEMDAVLDVIAKCQIPPSHQIPPSPPFSKGVKNRCEHEMPAVEPEFTPLANPAKKETATPAPPFEKGATASIPPFEKEVAASIPPFEKGGLGGICLDSATDGEAET